MPAKLLPFAGRYVVTPEIIDLYQRAKALEAAGLAYINDDWLNPTEEMREIERRMDAATGREFWHASVLDVDPANISPNGWMTLVWLGDRQSRRPLQKPRFPTTGKPQAPFEG
jgi:hypothetical protein